jgi:hypothetical protein
MAIAGAAFGQDAGRSLPSDLHLLVGKKVSVGRLPLCEPNTYSVTLLYAGQVATVIAVKKGHLPKLSSAVLARMPDSSRDLLIDAENAGTLLLQFSDGKQFDTCGPIGPSRLSQDMNLAPGETVPMPEPSPAPAPSRPVTGSIPTSQPGPTTGECPVVVTAVSSGDGGFRHALADALTTSEFERQLDETEHGAQAKHYLDFSVRNASDKAILGVEAVAQYTNRMGDALASSTLVSQNTRPIKPGEEYRVYSMDRAQWVQSGVGDVTLFINRVRFTDGTFWADSGGHSCSMAANSK